MDQRYAEGRFLEWCFLANAAELAQDFALTRRISCPTTVRFLSMVSELSEIERAQLVKALSMHFKSAVLIQMGRSLSPEDRKWIKFYEDYDPPPISSFLPKGSNDRITVSVLVKALSTAFPDQKVSRFGGVITLKSNYRGMSLETWMDIGGRSHHVDFSHTLRDAGGQILIESEDPLHWLGIGRSRWDYVELKEAPLIVETIGISLERFRSAVDFILDER